MAIKKALFILSTIILLGQTSCRKDTIRTVYYQNRSEYDITIEKYEGESINYIDIANGDDYVYIYYVGHPTPQPMLFENSYKVRVIFNNIRVITWYNATAPKEGVYGGNYRQVKTGKHSYDMFFTFTPEMYDEAVPIEEAEE